MSPVESNLALWSLGPSTRSFLTLPGCSGLAWRSPGATTSPSSFYSLSGALLSECLSFPHEPLLIAGFSLVITSLLFLAPIAFLITNPGHTFVQCLPFRVGQEPHSIPLTDCLKHLVPFGCPLHGGQPVFVLPPAEEATECSIVTLPVYMRGRNTIQHMCTATYRGSLVKCVPGQSRRGPDSCATRRCSQGRDGPQ